MGRTPLPLTIWVDDAWKDHAEIVALREKGHNIISGNVWADIILSRAAFAWGDDMWSYLPAVLKEARKRKKEPVDVDLALSGPCGVRA